MTQAARWPPFFRDLSQNVKQECGVVFTAPMFSFLAVSGGLCLVLASCSLSVVLLAHFDLATDKNRRGAGPSSHLELSLSASRTPVSARTITAKWEQLRLCPFSVIYWLSANQSAWMQTCASYWPNATSLDHMKSWRGKGKTHLPALQVTSWDLAWVVAWVWFALED